MSGTNPIVPTPPDVVLYHNNCCDGFGAALTCYYHWGKMPVYIGVDYDIDPPDVKNKHVLILDFCYKDFDKDIDSEGQWRGAFSTTIIDHHKSSQEILLRPDWNALPVATDWAWEIHYSEFLKSKVWAYHSMQHSAAMLTWRWLNMSTNLFPPYLIRHVEDYDMWWKRMDGCDEVHANLIGYEYDFDKWMELLHALQENWFAEVFISEGKAILRRIRRDMMQIIDATKRDMIIGGQKVPVANVPYFMASEAAQYMAERYSQHGWAATYFDKHNEKRIFSLRIDQTRPKEQQVDVEVIARKYGGGGHAPAAGFTAPKAWEGDNV